MIKASLFNTGPFSRHLFPSTEHLICSTNEREKGEHCNTDHLERRIMHWRSKISNITGTIQLNLNSQKHDIYSNFVIPMNFCGQPVAQRRSINFNGHTAVSQMKSIFTMQPVTTTVTGNIINEWFMDGWVWVSLYFILIWILYCQENIINQYLSDRLQ